MGTTCHHVERTPARSGPFGPSLAALVVALTLIAAACGASDQPAATEQPPPDSGATNGSEDSASSATADDAADESSRSGAGSTDSGAGSDIGRAMATDEPQESAAPDRPTVAAARWSDCGDGFECAAVPVPLDHQQPQGPTIELALIRLPAGPAAKGSILVNFGGPGASGLTVLRSGFRLDEETMASHHLVSFDPRGIGQSSPLRCSLDLTDGPRPDLAPDDEAERADLDRAAQQLAQRCGEADSDLLPHLGTESVVADLDLLRQAVGDERLNYLGLSYGTLVGLRYAERYPDLVGRMVLDGVIDPSFSLIELLTQQAGEFERAFQTMDRSCGRILVCPEGGVAAAYDRLLATLDAEGPQGQVGPTELQIGTVLAMYSERLWPRLAAGLAAADDGDFSQIEQLHDLYVGGTQHAAYAAVSCIDSGSPVGAEQWDDFARSLAARAPRFGEALANELRTCAYWPTGPTSIPTPITAPGAPPILVISTTGDAPTPVVNARTVAAGLSDAGLVTVDDQGHTAYGKSFCVDRIVADYFADGDVPEEVHRC